jgi:curved DNA-binding protein CbpA
MPLKDHYKTLEVSTHSSLIEIKQSYRQLARRYHPDKNENNDQSTKVFQEIQAAYAILSNPEKRRVYDNELRHFGQYNGLNKDHIINSTQLVKQSKDLLQYINTIGLRSINYDTLTDFILGSLLNKENIALLLRANSTSNNEIITANILQACKGVLASRLFNEIAQQLLLLHPDTTDTMHLRIQQEIVARTHREKQNKLVPYAAIGLILLIVLAMYWILTMR